MPRFRKKPVVIEAMRVPAENEEVSDEMIAFLADADFTSERHGTLEIETLNGPVLVRPGEWIIRGVHGEYYPCADDIFHKTHEPVE